MRVYVYVEARSLAVSAATLIGVREATCRWCVLSSADGGDDDNDDSVVVMINNDPYVTN